MSGAHAHRHTIGLVLDHISSTMPTTKAKAWKGEQDTILNKLFQDKVIDPELEKRFGNDNRAARNYCWEKSKEHFPDYCGSKENAIRRLKQKARSYCVELTHRGARRQGMSLLFVVERLYCCPNTNKMLSYIIN